MLVKLKQPHTHDGKYYETGAELDMPDSMANWCDELNIAEIIPAKKINKPASADVLNKAEKEEQAL